MQDESQVLIEPEIESTRYKELNTIKQYIWLYLLLLLFEGGIRKWVLPGLATPLLLVRFPITLFLYFKGWKYQVFKANFPYQLIAVATLICFLTTLILGHGNLAVDIFGASIYLFDFPMIFVMGYFMDKSDVIKIGRFLIYMTIPMTFIIALQYFSPQSAFINRGVGGDLSGAGFSAAGAGADVYRPSGTFSFTNGVTLFYSLVIPFVIYFLLYKGLVKRAVLISAVVCIILAVPLSLSRSVFAQLILTMAFTAVTLLRNTKLLYSFLLMVVLLVIILPFIQNLSFFQTATTNFLNRMTAANDNEGGTKNVIMTRVFGGMMEPILNSNDLPIWGRGLGMGTNVGAKILTGSQSSFLISEGEWGRIIGEMGIILGGCVIIGRIILAFKIMLFSYSNIKKDILPWLLTSFGFMIILQGQWSQPTTLGFAVIMGGLILSSFSDSSIKE